MKIKCSYGMPNSHMTVGKVYETTYVEKKNFLDYGLPYFELIDDRGEPIGWAPCDQEYIRFEKYPTVDDAHGDESRIPPERLHEVNKDYRDHFLDENGYHLIDMVETLLDKQVNS